MQPGHRLARLLLAALAVLLGWRGACANFADGDFVPAARRGQFSGSRTQWHDLLGRHCPRFAMETKVAVPIPQPKGLKTVLFSYKIQFSFDGDRVLTPWVQIMGRKSPIAPIVNVELEHREGVLVAARAEVRPLSSAYLREHEGILREFQNATLWPKHLLVHYTWRHDDRLDAQAGLLFAFGLSGLVTLVLALSVAVSYQEKLEAFLAELRSEEPWSQPGMPEPAPQLADLAPDQKAD